MLSPIALSVASVPRWISRAWIVPCSMFWLSVSQASTAFRSAIFLSRSSTDMPAPGSGGMPGMVPGICMPPHRFLTNSRVSVIPGMGGLSMWRLLWWCG